MGEKKSNGLERATLPALHRYMARDLPWLLDRQADRYGEKPFVVWVPTDGDGQTWSYAGLRDRVARVAAGLLAHGLRTGDRVILHMGNRPEFLAAWLGCSWAGLVVVSTNTNAGLGELRYFAEHSGAKAAITDGELLAPLLACGAAFEWIASTDGGDGATFAFDDLLNSAPAPRREPDPALPNSVMYTSGTTSRPKAVVFTHANALWCAEINAAHMGIGPDDRALVYLPLFHLNALGYSTLATLWAGGTIVLQPKFSASRWWDVSIAQGCTWAFAGPFVPGTIGPPPAGGHSFRFWGYQWGNDGAIERDFGIPLVGIYGMTETISQPILSDPQCPPPHHAIGRVAPDYALRIIDETGADVAPGDTGKLLVGGTRGISLFWEYLHDAEATAKSFPEPGWFDTGDMIQLLDDGSLKFADREKDMLKVGGENVAASEIEAVIATVPGVRECAVVGRRHRFLDEVPVAFVVAGDAGEPLAVKIRAACAHELARFKQPHDIRFVDALPRITIGKLDRKALRESLRAEALLG